MAEVRFGPMTAPCAGCASPLLLVVDDAACIREVLEDYAGFCGFRVATCSSGGEALAYLDRQAVDLVLVDLRMPQIDGLEVVRVIRQKAPQCQVVLMSGVGTISNAVEAIKLGARDYLEKPFNPDTLQALLIAVLNEFEARKSQPAAPPARELTPELAGMVGD